MGFNMRHYLHAIIKLPSIHYVYLSSYPVTNITEQKEMNILQLIQNPIIFVMRGPVSLKGVSELLSQGDGIIFDYELNSQLPNVQLTLSLQKSYVSPGVQSFIQSDIIDCITSHRSFYFTIDALKQFPPKRQSVLDLLIKYDFIKRRNSLSGISQD